MACPFKPDSPAIAQQGQNVQEDAIVPIPQPPTHWFVRNLPEMDPSFPVSSFWRLAKVYGDIFKVDLVAMKIVVVSSHELINEVMDESRFQKKVWGPLLELRALLGDGLFTAYGDEEVSRLAHLTDSLFSQVSVSHIELG